MTTVPLTRLHIAPLTSDLLPIVLGPSLSGVVQNISYHDIPTFPENPYGFLDLPFADAKRLITKLNGAILKGRKMKVEEARPKKRLRGDTDQEVEKEAPVQKAKPKARKDSDALEGYELPEGRKVKRGWTEPKLERSKRRKSENEKKTKSQSPSKYTNKEELLFHTTLPSNREDLGRATRSKNTKKSSSDHTVHEFEKTFTQPSFLRDPTSTSKTATHFEDGKGWVDKQGEIVEEEPPNTKRRRAPKAHGLSIDVAKAQQPRQSGRRLESVLQPEPVSSNSKAGEGSSTTDNDDGTSSSGSSSGEDNSSEPEDHNSGVDGLGITEGEPSVGLPRIDTQSAPATPAKVHPLEALFKKPKLPEGQESAKPSLEIETAFSFFDSEMHDDEGEEDEKLPPMPVTPFTSQDMNSRGVRSAAPTPDTAHPSRFGGYAAAFEARLAQALGDEDNPSLQRAPVSKTSKEKKPEQEHDAKFQTRFWAERAQNNRAWKNQRRGAIKEERQRENRSRRAKNR